MLFSLHNASKPFFDWVAAKMVAVNISANEVTLSAFILGIWSFIMLAFRNYDVALLFLCLNRFFDGLDGAVARRTQETDLGKYLDTAFDFIFYIGFFFFFSVGMPKFDFLVMMVMVAFSIDYITMSVLSILLDKKKFQNKKGLYPFSGFMDGTETFFMGITMCLIPEAFLVTSIVYTCLALFAAFARLCRAAKLLSLEK